MHLPVHRMRRYRRNQPIRDLFTETRLHPHDLIAPLFVKEGTTPKEAVESMPGVHRLNLDELVAECKELAALGIRAGALFPQVDAKHKDPHGKFALSKNNFLFEAIRKIKSTLPEWIVMTDIALDPYTNHGHDGVLDLQGRDVDNDRTVETLGQLAVQCAQAGADWVAPSDMMDGRVTAIRKALDDLDLHSTAIISYAAKFASAYYGPFREAVGSAQAAGTPSLDKRTYQLNPANPREALRDALLDEREGADALMVKPAGLYLDVLSRLRAKTDLPLAAYQVSGEYAQIHAAARLGWLDLKRARDESLLAIKRAGADLIITYFAKDAARDWAGK